MMFLSHCMFYSTSFNDATALKLVTFAVRKPNLIYCFWSTSRVGEEGGLEIRMTSKLFFIVI